MAAYNKFNQFVVDLGKGLHHLHAAGDALFLYLTNNAPSATLDLIKTDLAGITVENGYDVADAVNDYTEAPAGTGTLTCTDKVWTAGAGGFGPLQYAVLYNDTCAAPVDPLIAWWNYGSSISVLVGETFTVDFGASTLTIT